MCQMSVLNTCKYLSIYMQRIRSGPRFWVYIIVKTSFWGISQSMEDIGGSSSNDNNNNGGIIKEQDRLLPIANVGRLMKRILPQNAKISKEAKETMQECVSEFISFVTSEASEKCRKERRKTVNGDDICWALATLGFDNYAEPMRRYLHRYREVEVDHNKVNLQEKGNSPEEKDDELFKLSNRGVGLWPIIMLIVDRNSLIHSYSSLITD